MTGQFETEQVDTPGVYGIAAPQSDAPRVLSPSFSFAIGRALGTVVVTPHGRLDGGSAGLLAEVLRDLIDDQGNLSVVIDAHDVTVEGSQALATFVVAAQWARRHGGTLAVARASDALRTALTEQGLPDIVT